MIDRQIFPSSYTFGWKRGGVKETVGGCQLRVGVFKKEDEKKASLKEYHLDFTFAGKFVGKTNRSLYNPPCQIVPSFPGTPAVHLVRSRVPSAFFSGFAQKPKAFMCKGRYSTREGWIKDDSHYRWTTKCSQNPSLNLDLRWSFLHNFRSSARRFMQIWECDIIIFQRSKGKKILIHQLYFIIP